MSVAFFVVLILGVAQVAAPGSDITVEGQVTCLDSADPRNSLSRDDCKAGHGRYALRTASGEIHYFIPEDPRAEIFRDARLWNRPLRITGRVRESNRLEIINLRVLKEGKPYDVYYRCEVCNITTYSDVPCPCCQDPVEYRETPAKD